MPGSLETPRVSMSWFFSNSSISGEKVSKGRPRRCSSAAPVSWSAKASVRSKRLATRSRLTCRSSRRLGASIAPVTIGRTYYSSGVKFRPGFIRVRRIAEKLPEYAALDLETTGLDPARDRVIEIGAVAFTAEQVTSTLEQLVDPGRPVPDTVLRLTGIKQEELRGAAAPALALRELAEFLRGRQPVGHGARLDVEFLEAAGLWDESQEILDTLDLARILLPGAGSHSLPLLATEMGFHQPRPHRALDDADATRQLLLRLRDEAVALDEGLKEAMLALVAPYPWPAARFFAEALTAPNPNPEATTAVRVESVRRGLSAEMPPKDATALAGLLGPEGPLAGQLPGYEHRESQTQMLLAVAQIQARGGTLVVEAGTGTGKSLAYLVPSIARSVRHRERVVVSTNTHTLQEQLMNKDLPALREWLPWAFKAVLLKGRSNYVSLRRWRRFLAEPCRDSEELMFKLKVLIWLNTTESGHRSELRLHGHRSRSCGARSGP